MKAINDYIVERIRIDNIKSNEYDRLGKLEWSFESYYLRELCISNEWYAGVTRDNGYVVFWAPDSKWIFFVDRKHTPAPTRSDWTISAFPRANDYKNPDIFWNDFISSGNYLIWIHADNKTIDINDIHHLNVPKEAEKYLHQL